MSVVFDVKCPILGFENTRKMEFEKIDDYFARIKSLDGSEFSFTLINPYALLQDYEFDMPNYYRALLEVTQSSNIKVYNILILNESVEESRINLLAPVVLNFDNNSMTQVILDPAEYPFYPQAEKVKYFLDKRLNQW